jgi:hypothetical protein
MSSQELAEDVRALREEGCSPKEIARALGVRRADVAGLVREIAAEHAASAPERALAGCWVSPGWSDGLSVTERPDWPDVGASDGGTSGLVTLLVAREHRHGSVSVCGYLVDVYCLGVKNALGPQVMKTHELSGFVRQYFSAYMRAPLEAPIELARDLALGAVEYARGLGFEAHRDLEPARGHLGPWRGPSAIRFGREGKPMYVEGPHDNAARVLRTLEGSVGRDNFHFTVSVGPGDAVLGGRSDS